jgi:hypothetical protein
MTVYVVELEPVETRYTAQWKKYVPEQLKSNGGFEDVVVIKGPKDAPEDTTPGAFLNFSGTNYWKSEQLKTISKMFADGEVKNGDYFLYTDAWNPTVLQLKYMAELLGVEIKIGGMWHAGAYDPNDFLGRLISHKEAWVRHAELSMFYAFDDNFFATQDHVNMFLSAFPEIEADNNKIHVVGWPMEYMDDLMSNVKTDKKKDLVLFPHRIAPEKQLEIFEDLANELSDDAEFVVCQKKKLTKKQYHTMLGKAKIVFSANLQETLGISMYEGALCGAAPMVPDRLSYTEMYDDAFKYPSEWTESWESYLVHKADLIHYIKHNLRNSERNSLRIKQQATTLSEQFFSGNALYNVIRRNHNV